MKKLKYRQDKREMVTLVNGEKKNKKSLIAGDTYYYKKNNLIEIITILDKNKVELKPKGIYVTVNSRWF